MDLVGNLVIVCYLVVEVGFGARVREGSFSYVL